MKALNNWFSSFNINSTFVLQAGQTIRHGIIILTSILLVKSGLSKEEIGIYETLLFIGTTLSFFWVTPVIQSFSTLYPTQAPENQKRLLLLVSCVLIATSTALCLISLFGKNTLLTALTGSPQLPYFKRYILYLLFNFPTYILEIIYLLDNRPKQQLNYFITTYGIQLIAVLLPLSLGLGLQYSIYGLLAVAMIRFAILLTYIFKSQIPNLKSQVLIPKSQIPNLKSFAWICLPLIGYSALSGFAPIFDSWWINFYYHGDKALFAIYRYGAREFPIFLALSTGLSAAMTITIAKDLKLGLIELKQRSQTLQDILFPIAILLILFVKPLFTLIFSPQYNESTPIFATYLLLILSRVLFPQSILLALKDTKTILRISVAETILNILLDIILIIPLGLKGVALATVLAYLFEKAAMIIYLKKKHGISSNQYTNWTRYLLYAASCILAFIISIIINP